MNMQKRNSAEKEGGGSGLKPVSSTPCRDDDDIEEFFEAEENMSLDETICIRDATGVSNIDKINGGPGNKNGDKFYEGKIDEIGGKMGKRWRISETDTKKTTTVVTTAV